MADDQNKRINELDPKTIKSGNMLVPIWDPVTDVTYSMALSVIVPGVQDDDNEWSPDTTYAENDIRVFEDELWISLEDGNRDNLPSEPGSTFWTLGVRGVSGLVPWAAGIFSDTYVTVLKKISGKWGLYYLDNTTRPYNSTNFTTELAAGDWVIIGGGGGALREVYEYDSDLFTENATMFSGLINSLAVAISDAINSVNYDVGLDADPIAYTNYTTLSDVQTWITANGTGAKYWIKINIVYKSGRTERSQVVFTYQS